MAVRYLVGATNWNSTAAWSDQSGGSSGFSVPGSNDDVFLDGSSPSGSTVNANITVKSLDCNGFTGTLTHNASVTLTVAGNSGVCRFASGMTYTLGSTSTSALTFTGTSGTMLLTTAGKTLGSVTLSGTGGTVQLQDALTVGTSTAGTLTVSAGVLDCNNKNISMAIFSSSSATARLIVFGSSAWTVRGTSGTTWNTGTTTNLTVSTGTGSVTWNNTSSNSVGSFQFPTLILNASNTIGSATTLKADVLVAGSNNLTVPGSWDVASFTKNAGQTVTLSGGSGTTTIKSNGQSFANLVISRGAGVGTQLSDALSVSETLTLTTGIDANNMNVTAGAVVVSGTTTRTVAMGTGTWTLTGSGVVWNALDTTGLTLTPSTSTIKLTDASSADKTFIGSGLTYGNLWLTGAGTGAFVIRGGNKWADFKVDTPPHTIKFQPGTIQRVTSWTVNGTAGNLMTLVSETTGEPWGVLLIGGGSASSSYVSVRDSVAF